MDIIEQAQPFRREWPYTRMRSLKRMDDHDKHRTLTVITGSFQTFLSGYDPENPPPVVPLSLAEWERGEAVFQCTWATEMSAEVRLYLAFGAERPAQGGARVTSYLHGLIEDEVQPLVQQLEPFVTNPPEPVTTTSWQRTHACA